ncbi:MAG: O-antigen ligase family protein, partial [Acidimicrobiales bacterium]
MTRQRRAAVVLSAGLALGLGAALGVVAAGFGGTPGLMVIAALVGLVLVVLVLLPERRLPPALVSVTILGMALAVARAPQLSNAFDLGRFLGPLALVVVGARLRTSKPLRYYRPKARLVFVGTTVITALSVFVSLDPKTTLTKWLALVVVFLAVGAAVRWAESRQQSLASPVHLAFVILVVSNLVVYGFGVGAYSGRRFMGWTSNPNALGIMCGLAVPVFAARLLRSMGRRRGWAVLLTLVSGTVLLLSGSRSALLGAMLATVAVLRINRVAQRLVFPVLLLSLVLIAPLAFKAASENLLQPVERTGESGREEVWPVAWREMGERPFLGAGFATTEDRFLEGEFGSFQVFQGGQFHNSYLEAGVETGVFGGLALVLAGLFALSYVFRPVA